MNAEENKFQIPSRCLEDFFVPWLCTLLFWHMFNWVALALKLVYKTKAVQQDHSKRKKKGQKTDSWSTLPSHALALGTWDRCRSRGLLRQNSNKSLCNKDTCTEEHFRQRQMTETNNIKTIALERRGRVIKESEKMVAVEKHDWREVERRNGRHGKSVVEAWVVEMVLVDVGAEER